VSDVCKKRFGMLTVHSRGDFDTMGEFISQRRLIEKLDAERKKGRRIVFTNGCFDIIHAGHVRYLRKARSLGDILVVGLNSDSSVRKIKGGGRPVVGERDRAEVLSALDPVDYVVLFSDETPLRLIERIRPDVLVKGADWKEGEIAGAEVVKRHGGSVSRIRLARGRSTTEIIKRIVRLHKGGSK